MLELNRLYNMDCMEGMKEIPDKFFELAITDPPYGINVGSAPRGGNRQYIPFGGTKAKNQHWRRKSVRWQGKQIQVGGGFLLAAQNLPRIRRQPSTECGVLR